MAQHEWSINRHCGFHTGAEPEPGEVAERAAGPDPQDGAEPAYAAAVAIPSAGEPAAAARGGRSRRAPFRS